MAHQHRRRLTLHEILFRECHFWTICLRAMKSINVTGVLFFLLCPTTTALTLYRILFDEEMVSSRFAVVVDLASGASGEQVEGVDGVVAELAVFEPANIEGGGRSCAFS